MPYQHGTKTQAVPGSSPHAHEHTLHAALLALQCKTYTKIDGTSRTGELLSTINVPDAFKIGSVAVGPISLKHPRVGALKVGGHGAIGVPGCACCCDTD
jgi:hypothetical protein